MVEAIVDDRRVYFIEAVGLRLVKIGLAGDPEKRLRDLQTASPAELRLVATVAADDARRFEAWLHYKFAEASVRGEWFRLTKELKRLIGAFSGWPMRARWDGDSRVPSISAPVIPGESLDRLTSSVVALSAALGYGEAA